MALRYADRHLTIAALDTVSVDGHMKRATALKAKLETAHDGVVWFDLVADLGDGFDSTYAMATLLARKEARERSSWTERSEKRCRRRPGESE